MKTPTTCTTPHPSGSFLRHFRSPDRKPAAVSASRHLEATSCFPLALCHPRVVVRGSTPLSFPRLHPSNSEGAGMVDVISKLVRRQSRALQAQVS